MLKTLLYKLDFYNTKFKCPAKDLYYHYYIVHNGKFLSLCLWTVFVLGMKRRQHHSTSPWKFIRCIYITDYKAVTDRNNTWVSNLILYLSQEEQLQPNMLFWYRLQGCFLHCRETSVSFMPINKVTQISEILKFFESYF